MNNKYLMFVDCKGHYDETKNHFLMVGVIFETDYCTDCEGKKSELTDKIKIYKEQIVEKIKYKGIDMKKIVSPENVFQTKKFFNILKGFPQFLKNLKFHIITTCIKQNKEQSKNLYELSVSNLIKKYYSFLKNKKSERGGIIIQGIHNSESENIPQTFFDIYNERGKKFYMYKDMCNIINKFMICESYNKEYKNAIDLNNTICSVLFGMLDKSNNELPTSEYYNLNKVLNVICSKMYEEEVNLLNDNAQKNIDMILEKVTTESRKLKEKVTNTQKELSNKDLQISELINEVKILKQKLNNKVMNKSKDNVIYEILSDVDNKIQGIKQAKLANANN